MAYGQSCLTIAVCGGTLNPGWGLVPPLGNQSIENINWKSGRKSASIPCNAIFPDCLTIAVCGGTLNPGWG
jgi:hypothetical protein